MYRTSLHPGQNCVVTLAAHRGANPGGDGGDISPPIIRAHPPKNFKYHPLQNFQLSSIHSRDQNIIIVGTYFHSTAAGSLGCLCKLFIHYIKRYSIRSTFHTPQPTSMIKGNCEILSLSVSLFIERGFYTSDSKLNLTNF